MGLEDVILFIVGALLGFYSVAHFMVTGKTA